MCTAVQMITSTFLSSLGELNNTKIYFYQTAHLQIKRSPKHLLQVLQDIPGMAGQFWGIAIFFGQKVANVSYVFTHSLVILNVVY